jgi:hypothetical protein
MATDDRGWNRRAFVAIGYVWFIVGPLATLVWFGAASSGHGSVVIWIPVAVLALAGAVVQSLLVAVFSRRATSIALVLAAALVPFIVACAAVAMIAGVEVLSAFPQFVGILGAFALGLAAISAAAARFYGDRRAL